MLGKMQDFFHDFFSTSVQFLVFSEPEKSERLILGLLRLQCPKGNDITKINH